jgi:branched-chain amino acid transport system ATP-binding protein
VNAALRCTSLTSGYAGVPVVRGLDLEVAPGEVVALLGPNGAGKTTTLLTLSGVLAPIDGTVDVLGKGVPAGRPHLVARRGVALVPDDRSLFFGLTSLENLKLGMGRKSGGVDLDTVLGYFPALEPKLSTRAGLLSGGEQQMLAIARAITGRPKVLMVDEMSLGLAPVIVKGMLPVIRKISADFETAVLLVEQHVDLALQVADRAYVLNHGDVVAAGKASDLARDRDLLQASYLGEVSKAYGATAEEQERLAKTAVENPNGHTN